jgi:hypothetical protein
MAVFSRYSSVIEADGYPMTVRSALARINETLDQVLNEQEGDFDSTTRFAIAWYRQHGFSTGRFGDADNMARARNTAVDTLDRNGVLTSRAGNVALIKPADLPANYDVAADEHTSIWEATQHLIRILEANGIGRMLLIRHSKFDKSRELPLHASTVEALRAYAAVRDRLWPQPTAPSFFVSTVGNRLVYVTVQHTFSLIARAAGLQARSERCRPRLHDTRHSFACATLLGWYRSGVDVEACLPLLSAYLGHARPQNTYWYLSAIPELLSLAALRREQAAWRRP